MSKILAVALTTIRETIRSRTLQNLFVLSLLLIGLSPVLGNMAGAEKGKVILDLSLASVHLCGALIAILVGAGLVSKETDRKIIQTIITKPVARWEFYAGKYLGFLGILLLLVLIQFLLILVILRVFLVPISPNLLLVVMFVFLEYMLITALAVFFSGLFPASLSSLLTAVVFAAGHFVQAFKELGYESARLPVRIGMLVFTSILPDLEMLNYRVKVAYDFSVSASEVIFGLVVGLGYTGILLILGAALFSRRRNFA